MTVENLPAEPLSKRAVIIAALPGIAGDALGALVSALGGDPVSSAMAGSMLTTAVSLDQVGRGARQQRAVRALEVAAEETGRQELVDLALGDPVRLELLQRVLEASARSTMAEKVVALGRVLAQGLQGDTVDEAMLLAGALADLEAPHVQVLALVTERGDELQHAEHYPNTGLPGLTVRGLIESLPGHEPVLELVLTTLEARGLIRDVAAGTVDGGFAVNDQPDGRRFQVTRFGTAVTSLLGG